MRYLDNFFSVAILMFFERTKSHMPTILMCYFRVSKPRLWLRLQHTGISKQLRHRLRIYQLISVFLLAIPYLQDI